MIICSAFKWALSNIFFFKCPYSSTFTVYNGLIWAYWPVFTFQCPHFHLNTGHYSTRALLYAQLPSFHFIIHTKLGITAQLPSYMPNCLLFHFIIHTKLGISAQQPSYMPNCRLFHFIIHTKLGISAQQPSYMPNCLFFTL